MKDDQTQSITENIRSAFSRIGKKSSTSKPDRSLEPDLADVVDNDNKEADAYREFNADSDSRVSPTPSTDSEGISKKKIAIGALVLTILALFLYWPQNPKPVNGDVNQSVENVQSSAAQHSSLATGSSAELSELNEDWREFSSDHANSSEAKTPENTDIKTNSNDQVEEISTPSQVDGSTQNNKELGFLTNLPESDIQLSSSSSSSSASSASSTQIKLDKTIKLKANNPASQSAVRNTQATGTNDIHKKLNLVLDELHSIKQSGVNGASIVEAPNLILLSIAKARKYCDGCVAHAWINLQGVEREIGDGDTLEVNIRGVGKTYITKIEDDRLSLIDKSGVVFSFWPR